MSKEFKAISTIVVSAIGVGFLALPYSIFKVGTLPGIIILIIAGILTLVTNLALCDIITKDKGNRQLPGYTRKYLGTTPSHLITVVSLFSLFGVLLAYSVLVGSAIRLILLHYHINLSAAFLSLGFIFLPFAVLKYGVKTIGKIASIITIILIVALFLITVTSLSRISSSNVSAFDFKGISPMFGVAIFALSSSSGIIVIDEIIGYDRKKYKRTTIISILIVLCLYLLFGISSSLGFGNALQNGFLEAFNKVHANAAIFMSLFMVIVIFSPFILVLNNIKEILAYDYKVRPITAISFTACILIVLIVMELGSFESIISITGNMALVLQNLFTLLIWFKLRGKASIVYRIIVALSIVVLITGMLLQLI